MTDECIPKYPVKPAHWRRPLWMTSAAVKLKKRKYWAWRRYADMGSYHNYENYTRKRNAAQNLSNKLRRNVEKLIAKEAKSRPKSFWTYVKNQTKSREGLSPLIADNGETTETDSETAEVSLEQLLFISLHQRRPYQHA